MSKFLIKKNPLTFFMGGDNFMVVASIDGKKMNPIQEDSKFEFTDISWYQKN